jgi:hypothetical protein
MIKTTLLATGLFLFAVPAFAETAAMSPAEDNMLTVLSACAVALGGAPALETALTGNGWTKGETTDGETEYTAPNGAEDSLAYVSEDGTTCTAWSSAVTIAQAQTMAQAVLEQVGVKKEDVSPAEDDYGCKGLKLATGETVSVVSSDETPVCDGGTGAMVTFTK